MQSSFPKQFTVHKTNGADIIVNVDSSYPKVQKSQHSGLLLPKNALYSCGNGLYTDITLKLLPCFFPNSDTVSATEDHTLLSGNSDPLYGPFSNMLKFNGRPPDAGEFEIRPARGMCKNFRTLHNIETSPKLFRMAWCQDCHTHVYSLFASQNQLPYLAEFLQQIREANITYFRCLEFGMYLPLDFTI